MNEFYCIDKDEKLCLDQLIRNKTKPYIDPKGALLPHPSLDDKETILRCAQEARIRANECLERAEHLLKSLPKIKDWRLKERLKVLTSSAIGTVLIVNPKAKFLAVALGLLTDLIINEGIDKTEIVYNIFLELSYASHCLEEFEYYSRLSINADIIGSYEVDNEGWKYANFAINSLTRADMLTASLEYPKSHGFIVSNYITELRGSLINDMINHRKLTYGYLNRGINFKAAEFMQ